jgi:AraC-like DNA-binding protein
VVRPIASDTKGIVNPVAALERFALTRHPPSPGLRWAVESYWVVRWDVRDQGPCDQRVVPHPAVHLVFEAGRAEIESISPNEFIRRIEGRGQVLGVKFQPAGFRPFLGTPVSNIAGSRIPASVVFGELVDELARAFDAAEDLNDVVSLADLFLQGRSVKPLAMTATVNAIVAHVVEDRSITRVTDLAERLDTSTRRLERLFAEHVGLGPKWVINRCRLHEAVEMAARSEVGDWATVAAQLGYSDQSHLVRDVTAAIGNSPQRYARLARRHEDGERPTPG